MKALGKQNVSNPQDVDFPHLSEFYKIKEHQRASSNQHT